MLSHIWFWLIAVGDLLRVFSQLLYGIWRISGMPKPMISIFGGSKLTAEDSYAQQASELAQRCVNENISVLTGGGPGIMQAANCGAIYSKKGKGISIGIGVRDLKEENTNTCATEQFILNHFFARKWLLTQYSCVFVFFPGGFGTLDELFEVLTLMQTGKLPLNPIIVVGSEYWGPLREWVQNEPGRHGLLSTNDGTLVHMLDDLDEVFAIIQKECSKKKTQAS